MGYLVVSMRCLTIDGVVQFRHTVAADALGNLSPQRLLLGPPSSSTIPVVAPGLSRARWALSTLRCSTLTHIGTRHSRSGPVNR